jgi:hypothetical protein
MVKAYNFSFKCSVVSAKIQMLTDDRLQAIAYTIFDHVSSKLFEIYLNVYVRFLNNVENVDRRY